MKNLFSSIIILSLSSLFFSTSLFSQSSPADNPLKTDRVAIFKNGQSFVMKSGKVPTKNGTYLIKDQLPNALFGTLWFDAPGNELLSIKSFQDSVAEQVQLPISNHGSLLIRNIGKSVELKVRTNAAAHLTHRGEIMKVTPAAMGIATHRAASNLTLLKTDKGWVSIKEQDILEVTFIDEPNLAFSEEVKSLKPLIELKFKVAQAKQELDMMYLQNGLQWVPQYLLELEDDTSGTLKLQAEISNEAEDINNSSVDFVVGVANFKFATKNALLVNFLTEYTSNFRRNQDFQNQTTNFSNSNISYGVEDAPVGSIGAANSVGGEENEDLFFYTVSDFSLRKGGRAVQQLFSEKIKLEHLYETNLAANIENSSSYRESFLFSKSNQNPVYHVVKLENTTNQPWTTAPIMVMNNKGEKRPVSQDVLNFTASGKNGFVKLTESPEIEIKSSEVLLNRSNNVQRVYNRNYVNLKIQGVVKVTNYKSKGIALNVRRNITGKLLTSDVTWLKAEAIPQYNSPNSKNNVCWELELKSKETIEIKYEYDILVQQ